ncbi:hypothetical protein AB0M43_34240 [Longispora sp. NPDC051575]|uniref:hypothetical protein n=1 Tax=Longispora sp. NPDC051575 TaxID=3154943 RepID=UPI00343644E0
MRATRLTVVVLALGLLTVVPGPDPSVSAADPAPPSGSRIGYTGTEESAIVSSVPGEPYVDDVVEPANDYDAAWNDPTGTLTWISTRGDARETDGEIWYRGSDSAPRRVTDDDAVQRHPTLSPDGRWIAYEQDGEIRLIRPNGTDGQTVTRGNDPSWSPDGTRLLFGLDGAVHSAKRDGTDDRRLGAGGQPAQSPDGTRIAFVNGPDVFVMPAAGGTATRLLPAGWGDSADPAWSPNGARIAFVTRKDDNPKDIAKGQAGDVYAAPVAGGAPQKVGTLRGFAETRPSWYSYEWDGETETTVVYSRRSWGPGTDVWSADQRGEHPVDLTARQNGREQDPAYSPDGARLAYTEWRTAPDGSPQSRILVADASGANARELTAYRAGVTATEPAWSPDGTMIAYVESRVPDTVPGPQNVSDSGAVYGFSNIARGGSLSISGDENSVFSLPSEHGTTSVNGSNNVVAGGSNTIYGGQNAITGEDNRIGSYYDYFHANQITGSHNYVSGNANTATGDGNTVTGANNIVVGNNNRVSGNGNRVVGDNLVVSGDGELDPAGQVRIARVADRAVVGAIPMPRHSVGSDRSPAWSPDGTRIAFARTVVPYDVSPPPPPPVIVNVAPDDGGPFIPLPADPVYPAGVFPNRVDRQVRSGVTIGFRTGVRGLPSSAGRLTASVARCDPGITVTPPPGGGIIPSAYHANVEPKVAATASGTCVLDYALTPEPANGATASHYLQVIRVAVVDAAPIVVVDDQLAQGTKAGAAVQYPATATDSAGRTLPVTCDHASGATFPVGVTPLRCSATDAAGLTGTDTAEVTVYDPTRTGYTRIWVASLDVTGGRVGVTDQIDLITRIASGDCEEYGNHQHPAWSPDGLSLAFDTEGEGWGICVLPVAGGRSREVVTDNHPDRVHDPAWSPDGGTIAFTSVEEYSCECLATETYPSVIQTVPAGGGAPTDLVTSPGDVAQPVYQRVPDLRVTLAAAPPTIPFLGATTLEFTVTNLGPVPAPGTGAVFTLPGLKATALQPARGTCDVPTARCDLGALAPGETVAVAVTAQGTAQGPHDAVGTATSSIPDGQPDDDSATARVTVGEPFKDLAVVASATPTPGYVGGDPLVVEFTVVNGSQIPLADVRLTITLPAALLPATAVTPATCQPTGCALGDLPAGGTATVRVTVPPKIALTSTGTGTVTSATTDPNPANNVATTPIVVKQPVLVVNLGDRPGRVAYARGTDFPPGAQVRLPWTNGINRTPGTATVDANGTFTAQVLVFDHDPLGVRSLRAESVAGARFGPVTAPFLVQPRAEQPPLR